MCPYMFSIILVLFSVQASLLAKNDFVEDPILIKFIDAFKDEKTIDSWMKDTKRDDLYFYDLFKGITNKISDVLISIHTDNLDVFKSLILKTHMILDKISYPYYETFNIIESVKRIVLINDDQKLKNDTFDNENFLKDILYEEYDSIYGNLELTIIQVGLILDSKNTLENYEEWKNSDHCRKFKPKIIDQNLSSTVNFIELSNKMIEDILPVDNNTNSYVEAHIGGLKKSRRCVGSEMYLFIRGKYNLVCPENMWQYLRICDSKQSDLSEIDITNYFGKTFVCNKTTAKVLAMLFHFYSEVKKRNTKYEIIMKENNEYQIKWSLSKKASYKAIENFWKNQEILDPSQKEIIDEFDDIQKVPNKYYTSNREEYLYRKEIQDDKRRREFEIEYARDNEDRYERCKEAMEFYLPKEQYINGKRIDDDERRREFEIEYARDNEDRYERCKEAMEFYLPKEQKPVKTKLILLSCGHQLGFNRIFKLKKNYTKYHEPLKCPYKSNCGSVYVVGCYEADVYELE